MSHEPFERRSSEWNTRSKRSPSPPPSSAADAADPLRFVKLVAEFTGVAALLVYFLAWSAIDAFYLFFDIQMQEAGISPTTLVGNTASYFVTYPILFVIILPLLLLGALAATAFPVLVLKLIPHGSMRRRVLPVLTLIAVFVTCIGMSIYLGNLGHSCAMSVAEKGETATALGNDRCNELDSVGVLASDVNAVWLSKPPEGINSTDRLVFLGEANGLTILYDRDGQLLFRVPTGTVQLTYHLGE